MLQQIVSPVLLQIDKHNTPGDIPEFVAGSRLHNELLQGTESTAAYGGNQILNPVAGSAVKVIQSEPPASPEINGGFTHPLNSTRIVFSLGAVTFEKSAKLCTDYCMSE